jgi:hypothetical protein
MIQKISMETLLGKFDRYQVGKQSENLGERPTAKSNQTLRHGVRQAIDKIDVYVKVL